jgi:hypothetical protein
MPFDDWPNWSIVSLFRSGFDWQKLSGAMPWSEAIGARAPKMINKLKTLI